MNKQKDRLVELVGKELMDYSSWATEMALAGNYDMPSAEEVIADKLLADGWMRPPKELCEYIGDIIFVIADDEVTEVLLTGLGYDYTSKDLITTYDDQSEKVRNYRFTDFGKTVFLSREEAEAKLKEGVQG